MLVDEITDEFFVAVVGTVDDIRVAAAGNVLLELLFDWRIAWDDDDDDREFFDDCCWEWLFERLTVYWLWCGGFVGNDRLLLLLLLLF